MSHINLSLDFETKYGFQRDISQKYHRTHTHTQRERERERDGICFVCLFVFVCLFFLPGYLETMPSSSTLGILGSKFEYLEPAPSTTTVKPCRCTSSFSPALEKEKEMLTCQYRFLNLCVENRSRVPKKKKKKKNEKQKTYLSRRYITALTTFIGGDTEGR